MPRRIADYPDAYAGWNYVSSVGSYISALGLLVFFVGVARLPPQGKAAGNPWGPGATTLEWTLPSPPPFHQFNELPGSSDVTRERKRRSCFSSAG